MCTDFYLFGDNKNEYVGN